MKFDNCSCQDTYQPSTTSSQVYTQEIYSIHTLLIIKIITLLSALCYTAVAHNPFNHASFLYCEIIHVRNSLKPRAAYIHILKVIFVILIQLCKTD